jgi:hypothetical protein
MVNWHNLFELWNLLDDLNLVLRFNTRDVCHAATERAVHVTSGQTSIAS